MRRPALREKLLSDPHRPGYHFVTPEGRCMPFDPNGAIFWKGRYHLFYIFQDARGHNWGHVSSTDLFHWRHHPTGLVSGMFSGNCFVNRCGRPTMCYHQVGQGNAMAVAVDDELNEWQKLDSNPITPQTKPGDPHHDAYRSWDPYGWLEGDTYYAIFGGERAGHREIRESRGSMAVYWRPAGQQRGRRVAQRRCFLCGLLPPGQQAHAAVHQPPFGLSVLSGRVEERTVSSELPSADELGGQFVLCAESLLDDQGRRIMWAWIFDHPAFGTRTDYGWSGTMSLPRVLSLGDDGMLRMDPPAEIAALRYNARQHADLTVPADAQVELDSFRGDSLELNLVFDAPAAQQCGVKVRCAPGGEEQTLIYYDAGEQKLKIDTTKSGLAEGAEDGRGRTAGPAGRRTAPAARLVDKSVVEVFANGRQAVMRRVYPSRADSIGTAVFSRGGAARVTALQAWDMMPSNPY